jgi:microcin C transport system substrate-binding protein
LIFKSLLPACAAAALIATPILFAGAAPAEERAQTRVWRHGVTQLGDLKYPPDFRHFDYVNPNAPKGGTVRLTGFGTFDNFNLVVAQVKGSIALGITQIYDTLLVPSLDETDSYYGLLAEALSYPEDVTSATFRLRPSAKWHDGQPVTPEDVIFSFNTLKANSPLYSKYYQHVVKAEKTGEHEVTFTFDAPGNRELPLIVGQLIYVLPKHWWEGTDEAGNKRNVANTTLEKPLGSGAYRIKEFVPGRSIVYERVKDYWGKDLPVAVGQNNFDELRFEYYRDSQVALEAFKADQIDFRAENSAKDWATGYDFPAVTDKRVVKEEFPERARGYMQAFVLNTRRSKFADQRVRRAFNLALDFEEMNKQLFFGQYRRISSYFDGTELASSGLPSGLELEILQTVRDQVPPEVFTTEYKNPVNGSPENVRNNLREATRLLREAGWEIRNQKLVNAKTGEPMAVEVLNEANSPNNFERHMLFYKPPLERLGITVTIRNVDDVQYENRVRKRDFVLIVDSWPETFSPGNEQRDFLGSKSANDAASSNTTGIKNPVVDKLIERVISAKNREELVAATRALDRVLLWNKCVVPNWDYPFSRMVRWDRFSHPAELPKYGESAVPAVWWWDAAKGAKVGGRS